MGVRNTALFEKTTETAARSIGSSRFVETRQRSTDDQDRFRRSLGARPGRGARLLYGEARLGAPRRRDPARVRQLPLADRRAARAGRCFGLAECNPGPAG